MGSSGIIVAVIANAFAGGYIGYKIGFYKGYQEGFVSMLTHFALVLRKTFREVDTVTNGPYVINRVVNLLGIEEVYNLTDREEDPVNPVKKV